MIKAMRKIDSRKSLWAKVLPTVHAQLVRAAKRHNRQIAAQAVVYIREGLAREFPPKRRAK